MQLIQSKEYLSIKETCLLLGISRMSLYRYIKNETITTSNIGGKIIIKKQVINDIIK
jgi:excisionase family DNA binding protein